MNPVTFGEPRALLALLVLIPIAAAWAYTAMQRRRADSAYGGAQTLRVGWNQRRAQLHGVLVIASVVCAAIAMARPQWGTADSLVQRTGSDIVIVLDISRSMLATDVLPSRAAAIDGGLQTMLEYLGGDRVALVTFGGTAFPRSPLTLDLDAIRDLVSRSQRESALVRPGSDIGTAINEALRLLDVPDRARAQVIVLISDGEEVLSAGAASNVTASIEAAKRDGVRIHTITAGTEQGAAVPGGEGVRPGPTPVISRADRALMMRIATEAGGTARDVRALPGLAVEFSRLQQSQFDSGTERIPTERFQWLLGIGLVLLLAQTLLAEASAPATTHVRTGSRRVLGIAMLFGSIVVTGCSGTDAYQRVTTGNSAFERRQFEQALAAYNEAKQITPDDAAVDYNIANALHRLERYEEAAAAAKTAATSAKEGSLFAHATYTIGNSAFRRSALTEAREAYVAVLQRDPQDDDARHNFEIVLRALNAQTPAPPPNGAEQPRQPAPGIGAPPPRAIPQPGTPQPGAAPGGPGQPGTQPSTGGSTTEAKAIGDLERILGELGEAVTAEEAVRVLDAVRAASERGVLRPNTPGMQDPNDR